MQKTGQLPPRRARKRFGQHFLRDREAIRKIVELVKPADRDCVLEIGPGLGALTELLHQRLSRLVAVEVDRDLAAVLARKFRGPEFRLIEQDALKLDLPALIQEEKAEKLLIVGNIPYNITASLLFYLLKHSSYIGKAILMVQKEVARRLVASPGNRDYGLMTVLLAMYGTATIRLELGPKSFWPRPRVESAVVEIEFEPHARRPVIDERLFDRVVRTAFGQRRKMLRNSLLSMVPDGERGELEGIAEDARIDMTRRPETLSLEEFARLSDSFASAHQRSQVS